MNNNFNDNFLDYMKVITTMPNLEWKNLRTMASDTMEKAKGSAGFNFSFCITVECCVDRITM